MKTIIERRLPLNMQYVLIDKKYIPLENSFGCACDNCGKLIANIATVKNSNGDTYNIGFDCLETILINNSLLSTNDIAEYEAVKKMIPKILRFSKHIKEILIKHEFVTGIRFETPLYKSDWMPFYWLKNNDLNSRDNDVVRLKDVSFPFLIETLKNIFPKLTILVP